MRWQAIGGQAVISASGNNTSQIVAPVSIRNRPNFSISASIQFSGPWSYFQCFGVVARAAPGVFQNDQSYSGILAGACRDCEHNWQQIAGASGIVFAILSVIAGLALAPQPPMSTDSVSKIVSYYANHRLSSYSFFALSAFLIGASTGGLETGAVGRWACWFGYGVAGLGLITSLSIIWPSASGLYALLIVDYLLFVIWVLWASISVYRRENAAVGAAAVGEAPILTGR